ncbi:hypothetical protein HYC85_028997 [Camellia sinensis]|uniref:Uncharacterized protein n=1 Tax=Camellia sinensis TaxID=4442 RepID=A0A7J7G0P8_CAMSI|nr:hypothetical protein HYC85_028997 [Camellia sinensis]
MNAERLIVNLEAEKEGRRTAERKVFHLYKVITSVEMSKEASIRVEAQLEGKVAELEAVIAVIAIECSALEAKY